MGRRRLQSSLMSPGLILEQVHFGDGEVIAVAHSRNSGAACPSCGGRSGQVHSRYERRLTDLPAHGRRDRIRLMVRRFRCGTTGCATRIFAERFGPAIVEPFARRTARLQCVVHHLGLALGGRPGQGLARRLLMPVSKNTLLRADRSAVAAALSLSWSNGQTEGHITKLKLVKRQMYGRAKLNLLRARLLGAA